jgi:thymidylate synthase (FAD)
MCELKFLIRIPMDAWRQMVRHRTASINEYSTRYTEAIDSQQTTSPDEWRLQAGSNKQGSDGLLTEWPEKWNTNDPRIKYPLQYPINTQRSNCKTPGQYLTGVEETFHEHAAALYRERLEAGVAREQARKDLPLSTYTEAYWKIDLHNLFHFLGLRMDSHAQLEIRLYANAIGAIAEQLFPQCWEAFRDYRLEAMQLSRMDILAAQSLLSSHADLGDETMVDECLVCAGFTNKREKEECIAKMKRLGIL